MSVQVTIELPEEVFSALRSTPEDFVREMRLASAVKWYELGMISQGKAAELAGISREAFIEGLCKYNVSPFRDTASQLVGD